MNKQEGAKTRYYVQWDTHARHMCTVLCSLMEHQSLVDLAICCGTNTIHAHKCVLAANSPYFREQLEKNTGTEQVIITGLDFAVVKSIIEFMYCGETNILDENLKYMIAAAKFFHMRGLQTLVSDHQDIRYEADSIHIPPPIFLPKKPKYPNAYRPVNNAVAPSFGSFKSPIQSDPYLHRKIKRKFVRSEAEKACAKEAAASRLALEALQKELATTTQMSSFVIEESCTETTVENFIPHSDETFIDNLNHIESVPLQVVNFEDLNNSLLSATQMINIDKSECSNNLLQFGVHTNATKDKLKRILGTDIPGNVEIMFRTSDGNFVNVTDDVLQNLSGGTLQYQIVDENGQVGEIRELQVQDQNSSLTNYEESESAPSGKNDLASQSDAAADSLVSPQDDEFVPCRNVELPNITQSDDDKQNSTSNDKLENKAKLVEEITELYDPSMNETLNHEATTEVVAPEDDLINVSSSSSGSSPEETSNNTTSPDSRMDETDPFVDALNKAEEPSSEIDKTIQFGNCDVSQFLNLTDVVCEENKEICSQDEVEQLESPVRDPKRQAPLKKSGLLGTRKLRTMTADAVLKNNYSLCSVVPKLHDSKEDDYCSKNEHLCKADPVAVDLTGDNIFSASVECAERDIIEDGSGDYKVAMKKAKLAQTDNLSLPKLALLPTENEVEPWQALETAQSSETYSPRKTRSSLKTVDDNTCQVSFEDCKEITCDNQAVHIKFDKPRRIMPSRKKKLN